MTYSFTKTAIGSTLAAITISTAQASDFQGYWSSAYGGNGKINFELTVINDLATFKYDTQGWGDLGYDTCQYVFKLQGNSPVEVKRNTAYGSQCLPSLNLTLSRSDSDKLIAKVNPEFGIEDLELWGVLRPITDADKRKEIPNQDILGIKFGMTLDQIDDLMKDQDYSRYDRDFKTWDYNGYSAESYAWGKEPNEYNTPQNLVYVTFTSKKEWQPDLTPVAATIGRDWSIPDSAQLLGATLMSSLEAKYGPSSSAGFGNRLYGRDGKLINSLSCPDFTVQDIPYTYTGESTSGEVTAEMGCGVKMEVFTYIDSSTGRAGSLKMRMTDSDLIWADFWDNWSHGQIEDMEVLYNGLFNSTGKGPTL